MLPFLLRLLYHISRGFEGLQGQYHSKSVVEVLRRRGMLI